MGGAGEVRAAVHVAGLAAIIFPVEIGSNPRITAYAPSTSWNGPLRLPLSPQEGPDFPLRGSGNQAELRQARQMLQTLRSLGVLDGVRGFVPKGFKVRRRVALQDEGSKSASVDEGRARLEQDEAAIQRLLSRVELELSNRDAVQRRETIARLKLAAAFSG